MTPYEVASHALRLAEDNAWKDRHSLAMPVIRAYYPTRYPRVSANAMKRLYQAERRWHRRLGRWQNREYTTASVP